jgi:hypothetical protein
MSKDKLGNLANRVLGKETELRTQTSDLTPIVNLMKQIGLAGDIVGREFEVYNPEGQLQFIVKQKPIGLNQINILLEELDILNRLEAEQTENEQKKHKVYNKGKPRSR